LTIGCYYPRKNKEGVITIMHSQESSDTAYLSYMLRMWLKRDGNGELVWCASLEEPGSRHTESFGDIGTMFSFIQSRLEIEMNSESTQPDQQG
jgi:hypothetical protein